MRGVKTATKALQADSPFLSLRLWTQLPDNLRGASAQEVVSYHNILRSVGTCPNFYDLRAPRFLLFGNASSDMTVPKALQADGSHTLS